jgi:uncharacterized membrane protein YtjA (UPF0391 family)
MLRLTLMFFMLALVAGALGFSGLAGAAAGLAKLLFFVCLVGFVISLIARRERVKA